MFTKQSSKKYIRQFNTSGTCNPVSDFYISRVKEINKALVAIEGVPGKSGGQYFTMFASRQMGKTTFVQELVSKLNKEKYEPVIISFETMIDFEEVEFYKYFTKELKLKGLFEEVPVFRKAVDFKDFVEELQKKLKKKLILIIDEFDGLNKGYLGKLLHVFREVYFHRGSKFNLHSLVLIGVRNITDVNMDNASPFNTNDELPLPLFTQEQVFDLMHQYEEETGQPFAQEVKEAVYYNTQGQPGLTNALCKFLVEDYNPGDTREIDMKCFNRMLSFFIHEHISKNAVNIINKAKQYKEQVIRIFDTQKKIEFNIDTDWIGYLYINGAIGVDRVQGSGGVVNKYIKFANPIYQKKIYNCFKPDLGGESARYFEPGEALEKYYVDNEQRLDVFEIIKNYQRYVNRRGSRAFACGMVRKDGRKYEAVYHYSLDAYMSSVLEALGGSIYVEFPTGNGKTDIFLQYRGMRYIVEIKNYQHEVQVKKAKQQIATYAKTEDLSEAYLVIFTEVHSREKLDVYAQEKVEGVTVYSVWVNVNFDKD